jgi:hypothetical protein
VPLIRIDLIRGSRDENAIRTLSDAVHEAVVEAFEVPPRDRYQVVSEHDSSQLIVQDSGLGIPRTRDVVVIQVITRPRSSDAKQLLYRLLADNLLQRCAISPSDVVISCTVNADDDWSFGFGEAQFLTGDL